LHPHIEEFVIVLESNAIFPLAVLMSLLAPSVLARSAYPLLFVSYPLSCFLRVLPRFILDSLVLSRVVSLSAVHLEHWCLDRVDFHTHFCAFISPIAA
jgi:hypothetical protein